PPPRGRAGWARRPSAPGTPARRVAAVCRPAGGPRRGAGPPAEIMARSDEGLPKLWVNRQALRLRRLRPALFGEDGAYRPLTAIGGRSGHVVAFSRGDSAITVAPRLVMRLEGNWMNTTIELPPGRWRNELDGHVGQGGTRVADLLARVPVAPLSRIEPHAPGGRGGGGGLARAGGQRAVRGRPDTRRP